MKAKKRSSISRVTLLVLLILPLITCKKDDNNNDDIPPLPPFSYDSVTIGTQVWMLQNLRTTKFKDGTDIPHVTDMEVWGDLTTPAYCWYGNDEAAYKDPYGALYNWYAVSTGKLCPSGWHVPTDEEWTVLTDYLGWNAGDKLKEAGSIHWTGPYDGANNESGFTALPGGKRWAYEISNDFVFIGEVGEWWTSTEEDANRAWKRNMTNNWFGVGRSHYSKETGYSVRCIKD